MIEPSLIDNDSNLWFLSFILSCVCQKEKIIKNSYLKTSWALMSLTQYTLNSDSKKPTNFIHLIKIVMVSLPTEKKYQLWED